VVGLTVGAAQIVAAARLALDSPGSEVVGRYLVPVYLDNNARMVSIALNWS
jgi:hypothetical protein